MRQSVLLTLFLIGSWGLAAEPAEAQFCERCQMYFAFFEDEFLFYELCGSADFPRSGYQHCESDGQPISYGGYCYESGSPCRWAQLDHSAPGRLAPAGTACLSEARCSCSA